MGATLKSKTHLINTFFDFLSRFLRVCANFFWSKKYLKTQNFKLILNPLKKLLKMHQQNKFDEHEKSKKSAYFRHVFANNFLLVHFFKTFLTD